MRNQSAVTLIVICCMATACAQQASEAPPTAAVSPPDAPQLAHAVPLPATTEHQPLMPVAPPSVTGPSTQSPIAKQKQATISPAATPRLALPQFAEPPNAAVAPPQQRSMNIKKLEQTPQREIKPQLPNTATIAAIIAHSRAGYPGNCGCPDDTDRRGHRCGGRSAYSRAGGRSVICYPRDVTAEMISRHRQLSSN